MQLCYVDEAGSSEICTKIRPDSSPILVLVGLTVSEALQKQFAWDFLQLKKTFRPQLAKHGVPLSEVIRTEVKGADLRADMRSDSRRRRRAAFGFLDSVVGLMEGCQATVLGEVKIKPAEEGLRDEAVYPDSIAMMAATFNSQLAAAGTSGMMILDSRTKVKNVGSVNGITTRKFATGGDKLPNLTEAPVFGHSDAHIVLQVADLLASAIVFPMACAAYCEDLTWNTHSNIKYASVWGRYASAIQRMEFRYPGANGQWRGGIRVVDKRNHRNAKRLFSPEDSP